MLPGNEWLDNIERLFKVTVIYALQEIFFNLKTRRLFKKFNMVIVIKFRKFTLYSTCKMFVNDLATHIIIFYFPESVYFGNQ